MNGWKFAFIVLFVVVHIVIAVKVYQLQGDRFWRISGALAVVNMAIRAPSVTEGLFGS